MTHDLLIVGLQLVAISAGVMMNHRTLEQLKEDMNSCFNAMSTSFDRIDLRFDRIDAKMAGLNAVTAQLVHRLETLEKCD